VVTVSAAALYLAFLGVSVSSLMGTTADPSARPTESAPALTVAMVRLVGGRAIWPEYAAALDHLATALGRPVETVFLSDSQCAEMIFNEQPELDAAFMSIYAYLLARQSEPGFKHLVVPIIGGHDKEQAVLVVRSDSVYREVEDLRGARAVLSPPDLGGSLAGNGYMRFLLDERGLGTAETFFSTLEVRDSQEANLRKVKEGLADATSVNRSQLASWPPGTFRVLAASEEYGMPPFVLSPRLSDVEADAIVRAMLAFEPDPSAVEAASLEGFVEAYPEQYEFPLVLLSYARPDLGLSHSGEVR